MTVMDNRVPRAAAPGLAALLDAGYDIYLSKDPAGYAASVSGPDGYEHDAIASTPDGALQAASPLAADEPDPAAGLGEIAASLAASAASLAETAGRLNITGGAIAALWEEAFAAGKSAR